jgi:hypothetical protein
MDNSESHFTGYKAKAVPLHDMEAVGRRGST